MNPQQSCLHSAAESNPLHDRNFLCLWASQAVSVSGNFVTAVALPLTAVVLLHASPFQLGLLTAINALPALLFGLMAGVWVDRLSRRLVLIASNLGRALLLVIVPIAWWSNLLSVDLLLLVQFSAGFLAFLFDVTYWSYLPTLVARSQLVRANSLMELSHSMGRIAGPSIGGFLVQLVSAPFAILADCVSFVFATAFLLLIQRPEPRRQPTPITLRRVFGEIVEGLRFIASQRLMASIAIFNTLFNLLNGGFSSLYVLYATDTLGLSAAVLGVVLGVGSAGAAVGAVVAKRLLGGGFSLAGLAAVGCGHIILAPVALLVPVPAGVLVIGQLLYSLFNTAYNVSQIALRQAITPEHIQGRAMASMRSVFVGAQVGGALMGGVTAQFFGVPCALVLLALGVLALAVWYVFSPVRSAAPLSL